MLIRYYDEVINLDLVTMFYRYGPDGIRFEFNEGIQTWDFGSNDDREDAFNEILQGKLQDLKMIDLSEKA